MTARPLNVLFFIRHAGYLRHYGSVVRLLAGRGHCVHVAFSQVEKDPGDARLAEELARLPGITYGIAPQRPPGDPWRGVAFVVRGLTDLARYVDPCYADAPKLRGRVAEHLERYVRSSRRIDPVSVRLVLLAVRTLHGHSSARLAHVIGRLLALLEQAVPTTEAIDEFVRARAPDAVLVTPLIELASTQVEYVKSASRLGIPSGVCVASWDNLTGKGLMRVVPDRVILWNDVQRREAVEMHGIPAERVVLTGAQRFDEWFERRPSTSADEFAERVGLRPGRPYVLYLCSSPFIAPDEVTFVEEWLTGLRASEDPRLSSVPVLVRPHPQNAAQWQHVDLSRLGEAVVWPRGGAQPDAEEARAEYYDSLAHSAAVVGVNTSALIEAAIVGKRVFTVLAAHFRSTQEGTLHFHYLLRENGGFLSVASSLEEHLAELGDTVGAGTEADEQTRRFVASFVRPRGLDRPATPLVAEAIEELARRAPLEGSRPPAAALVLRGLLAVASLGPRLLVAGAGPSRSRRLVAAARGRLRPPAPGGPKPPPEQRREPVEPSEYARRVDDAVARLRAAGAPVRAAEWPGDAVWELLFWIPFLRRVRSALGPSGLTDGAAPAADGSARLGAEEAERLVERFVAGLEPPTALLDRVELALLPAPDRPAFLPSEPYVGVGGDTARRVSGGPSHVRLDELEGADLAAAVAHARTVVAPWGLACALALLHRTPTVAVVPDARAAAEPALDFAYRVARELGTPLAIAEEGQLAGLAAVSEAGRAVSA